jgi:hypothetical protein
MVASAGVNTAAIVGRTVRRHTIGLRRYRETDPAGSIGATELR